MSQLGPHYFEKDGVAVTVNLNSYTNMIGEFLERALQERILENVWFQQDSAIAHTTQDINDRFETNVSWSVYFLGR